MCSRVVVGAGRLIYNKRRRFWTTCASSLEQSSGCPVGWQMGFGGGWRCGRGGALRRRAHVCVVAPTGHCPAFGRARRVRWATPVGNPWGWRHGRPVGRASPFGVWRRPVRFCFGSRFFFFFSLLLSCVFWDLHRVLLVSFFRRRGYVRWRYVACPEEWQEAAGA